MKKNQKGFGAVGILVVILIIGLIGTVGWLVYDRQNNKTDNREFVQTNQQEQKQGVTKKEEQTFFEINELGVKFEISKAPKGLYYRVGNNGKTAYFSLDDLKNTDCAADKTAQVALTRYTDEDFANDTVLAPSIKDNSKKFGEYYYFSMGGQAACSDDESTQEKASKLRTEILQLLPAALVEIQ